MAGRPRRQQVTKCGGMERALRLLQLLQLRFRPGKTSRAELVRIVMEEFECSRATAYRCAAVATDILGLETREEALDALATAPARNGHAPHAETHGFGSVQWKPGFVLYARTAEG